MKEEYQEIHNYESCPHYDQPAIHTVWLSKSTCTRFSDDVVDFSCSLDPDCKECVKEYP